jgi:hypothetical protein
MNVKSLIAELGTIIPLAIDSWMEYRELAILYLVINKSPQILDSLSNLLSELSILIDKLKKYKD